MSDFNATPWLKYQSLTADRLSTVADIIRATRQQAVALHDPLGGDSPWSLGCRVYSRTCFALREAQEKYTWLRVLADSENLRFTFTIGNIPVKFYHGEAADPPQRTLLKSYAELHHQQLALALEGIASLKHVLRLAVETDVDGNVASVSLVEVDDESGEVAGSYLIPELQKSNVVPLQTRPVTLPPVVVKPIAKADEKAKNMKAEAKNAGK